MGIRITERPLAHMAPSPSVAEAMEVSPAKFDTDIYQNMDECQGAKHHHNLDGLVIPNLALDERQEPKQHHLDELEVPKLPVDEHQEFKQHHNLDELEVSKHPHDEHQEPKQHHSLDELEVPKLPGDERQELKHHHSLDKVSRLSHDERQEAKQYDNLDELEVPEVPLNDDEYYHPFHDSPITAALKALSSKNISMVEYGAQAQFRCGYEEVPVVVKWAVPDEQLSLASQILVEHNFSRLSTRTRWWFGYWDTRCLRHGLGRAGWMRVHLLPLSLVGFTLEDTTEVPSMFAPDINIRTPKPPQYMLSLIRHLRKLRIGDPSRIRVEKDLLSFISSYILHGPPGHIHSELLHRLSEQQSKEGLLKELDEGVRFMKGWDWGNVEETDLALAERVVRDCHYVGKLTDVTQDPASPCRTPEPVLPVQ